MGSECESNDQSNFSRHAVELDCAVLIPAFGSIGRWKEKRGEFHRPKLDMNGWSISGPIISLGLTISHTLFATRFFASFSSSAMVAFAFSDIPAASALTHDQDTEGKGEEAIVKRLGFG